MLRSATSTLSNLASTTTKTQSSRFSTMVKSKCLHHSFKPVSAPQFTPVSTSTFKSHHNARSAFQSAHLSKPSRRQFATAPEHPQPTPQPNQTSQPTSQQIAAEEARVSEQINTLNSQPQTHAAAQTEYERLRRIEEQISQNNISALDKEAYEMELKFPGYSRFKADKMIFEEQQAARDEYFAELEAKGGAHAFQAKQLRAHETRLREGLEKLTDTTPNIHTGRGFTPAETHQAYLKSQEELHTKFKDQYDTARQEFYDEMKKSGIHTSKLARLFNSPEELALARPAGRKNAVSREDLQRQPRSFRALLVLTLFSIGSVLALKIQETQQIATASVVQYQTNGTIDVGDDFSGLIDHRGQEFSTYDYRGFYPLYYFGFTKCPDICPAELHKMMAALDQIEEKNPDIYRFIKPIFISVDALRDTPAQIAAYAENFHPRLLWVTGSHEKLTEAAKGFRIYFSIPDDATPDGEYNVDHSVFFFLMDRDGKLLSYYGQNKTADEIAVAMSEVVAEDLQRPQLEQAVGNKQQRM